MTNNNWLIGFVKGESCLRDNCIGIIEEHDIEGSCSCHVNPPCGYCTAPKAYCPVCGWSEEEEHAEEYLKNLNKAIKYSESFLKYKRKTINDLDNTKIDWIVKGHTHFSMICEGVYPENTTMEEIRKLVDGTFGGRFESFGGGKFKYIAYTD